MMEMIRERRLKWFDHVVRMTYERFPRRVMKYEVVANTTEKERETRNDLERNCQQRHQRGSFREGEADESVHNKKFWKLSSMCHGYWVD